MSELPRELRDEDLMEQVDAIYREGDKLVHDVLGDHLSEIRARQLGDISLPAAVASS